MHTFDKEKARKGPFLGVEFSFLKSPILGSVRFRPVPQYFSSREDFGSAILG